VYVAGPQPVDERGGDEGQQQEAAQPGDGDNKSAAALLRARLLGKTGPGRGSNAAPSNKPKFGTKQVPYLQAYTNHHGMLIWLLMSAHSHDTLRTFRPH
jgi:hypothetical protein